MGSGSFSEVPLKFPLGSVYYMINAGDSLMPACRPWRGGCLAESSLSEAGTVTWLTVWGNLGMNWLLQLLTPCDVENGWRGILIPIWTRSPPRPVVQGMICCAERMQDQRHVPGSPSVLVVLCCGGLYDTDIAQGRWG